MSTQEKIIKKIKKIELNLKKIKNLGTIDVLILNQNEQKRAALERFLYLICNSIISLLEMMITLKNYQTATNYAENAYILHENKEISNEQLELLLNIIGFRKVLSHDYEKLNLSILVNIVTKEINEIENLLQFFESKI